MTACCFLFCMTHSHDMTVCCFLFCMTHSHDMIACCFLFCMTHSHDMTVCCFLFCMTHSHDVTVCCFLFCMTHSHDRDRPWLYSVIPYTPDFPTEYQIPRHSNLAGLPTFATIWGPDFRASIIRLTCPHMLKQVKQIRITFMMMLKVIPGRPIPNGK